MPNYLHRTTKQYLQSVSPNDLLESTANYIFMPDMSAVAGVPSKYWTITGDVVSEMLQGEKDAVDAALESNTRDVVIQAEVDDLESVTRQTIILMMDEINILRQQVNAMSTESPNITDRTLSDRTLAQLKTQLRDNLGT